MSVKSVSGIFPGWSLNETLFVGVDWSFLETAIVVAIICYSSDFAKKILLPLDLKKSGQPTWFLHSFSASKCTAKSNQTAFFPTFKERYFCQFMANFVGTCRKKWGVRAHRTQHRHLMTFCTNVYVLIKPVNWKTYCT